MLVSAALPVALRWLVWGFPRMNSSTLPVLTMASSERGSN